MIIKIKDVEITIPQELADEYKYYSDRELDTAWVEGYLYVRRKRYGCDSVEEMLNRLSSEEITSIVIEALQQELNIYRPSKKEWTVY